MTLPLPPQDEHLPNQIEASVHQAGLEVQRQLFRVLIEKADQELVLPQRHGKSGAGIDSASEVQRDLLGPTVDDPAAMTMLVDDEPPLDESEEAQDEQEQIPAEWIATGFPGCDPALPVAQDERRAVDEGFVIVEPDEVKTKAQASTGRTVNLMPGVGIVYSRNERCPSW